MWITHMRRRAGPRSFPSRLLQDRLVERQATALRNGPFSALELLQPTRLVELQPAIPLAPPVVRLLGDRQPAADFANRLAARQRHLGLTQLHDDLLCGVLLPP